MITNERQYSITRKQLRKLEEALKTPADESEEVGDDFGWAELERAGIEGLVAQLKAEIEEYERLRSGSYEIRIGPIDELPEALTKARVAKGLNQRELGELLGLKAQQIQRYEASRYAGASLRTVINIASVLGLDYPRDGGKTPQVSSDEFFSRLQGLGLSREFVSERLLLPDVVDALAKAGEETPFAVVRAARQVERVFDWDSGELTEAGASAIELAPGLRFKTPKTTNLNDILPYVACARFVMGQAAVAARSLERTRISGGASEVRAGILERGGMTFEAALRYVWDIGVVVVPLADQGRFHGAWARLEGRDVIALKQRTPLPSRWLFDLLHELWHGHVAADADSGEIIELSPIRDDAGEEEEANANSFATDVLLKGMADELFEACMSRASGRIAFLKNAVAEIAVAEDVPVGALANHVAYRLSSEEQADWWGAATNLQERDDPAGVARDMLFSRLDLGALDEHGRHVLTRSMFVAA